MSLSTQPSGLAASQHNPNPPQDPEPFDDPAPTTSSRGRKVHAAKPTTFSGKDYKSFARSCMLYLQAARHDFDDDEQKILFVLSFMTEGLASEWAHNFIDEVAAESEKNDEDPDFGSFNGFMAHPSSLNT